jgi:hypothetical protein
MRTVLGITEPIRPPNPGFYGNRCQDDDMKTPKKKSVELVEAGALSRIGRKIIIFGKQYEKWCQLQANEIFDYTPAFNPPEHAHKRGGRHLRGDVLRREHSTWRDPATGRGTPTT